MMKTEILCIIDRQVENRGQSRPPSTRHAPSPVPFQKKNLKNK